MVFNKGSLLLFFFLAMQPCVVLAGAGNEQPASFWCLVPSLLAIFLALLTRRVLLSLITGVVAGTLILSGFSLWEWVVALPALADRYVVAIVHDRDNLLVLIFAFLIGGMIGVITENGGMQGMAHLFTGVATTRKKTLFYTWLCGLLVFFDDYANTLVVGNAMRPLTDKFRISREKLAYIVDCTAAPVASIAVITTWVGAELSYISQATTALGIEASAMGIFLDSLQYAFYPLLSLVLVLLVILTGRDAGPMRRAEARQVAHSPVVSAVPAGHWAHAVVPVVVMVGVCIAALYATGRAGGGGPVAIMGRADAYLALFYGSAAGLIVAVVLSLANGIPVTAVVRYTVAGMQKILTVMLILVSAWSLALVSGDLGTAAYLIGVVDTDLPLYLLPAGLFVLVGAVSFATGSSWGTMAIMYPVFLPFTWHLCVEQGLGYDESMALFSHVVSVILAASVFGDHCSPISDTTILTSMATACDHMAHVRTQLPYALLVAVVAVPLHVGAAYLSLPFYVTLPAGIGMLLLVVGRWKRG